MIRAIRHLGAPVRDSHLSIALAVAAVTMALMLWAIIWQSSIIAYQRDVIRWMWNAHFGGAA